MKDEVLRSSFRGFLGLKYVFAINVPVSVSGSDEMMIDAKDQRALERMVIFEMIRQKVPIRGVEVQFFRRVLGESLAQFARHFNMSDVGVMKWEQLGNTRLSTNNEMAVRVVMSAQIHWYSIQAADLVGGEKTPKELVVDFKEHWAMRAAEEAPTPAQKVG